MSEASQTVHADDNTSKAVKDKNCPFCGQAFTSSSLGRHLDLYIKERNPKKPDGIHDVGEIRKLRGGVTRRQGLARRRHTSVQADTTPPALHKRNNALDLCGSSVAVTPDAQASGSSTDNASTARLTANFLSAFPMGRLRWEATGVMNEVMDKSPDTRGGATGVNNDDGTNADFHAVAAVDVDTDADAGEGRSKDAGAMVETGVGVHNKSQKSNLHGQAMRSSQATARQSAKASSDAGRNLQEAVYTARAAELALRELVQCWRAADYATEIGSSPFDFDPMAMNFPALTLRCLRAQPTLFASTQLDTPSSWSTAPPSTSQFEALRAFFKEAFRKWKAKCATATTVQLEELPYPPTPPTMQPADRNQVIHRAVKRADALEQEANRHLEMAFADWEKLPFERRTELWVLELARGLETKQTEVDHLRNGQTRMKQEVANLKIQIAQLNRLQQPREYKLVPPAHLPVDEGVFFAIQDNAVSQEPHMVGLNLNDRHSDLNSVVSSAISRWKKVLAAVHSPGQAENSQRRGSLDALAGEGIGAGVGAGASAATNAAASAATTAAAAVTAGADLGSAASLCDSTSPHPDMGPTTPLLGSLRGRKKLRRRTRSSVSTAAIRTVTVPAVAPQQRTQRTSGQGRGGEHDNDGDDIDSDDDGGTNGDADTSGLSGLPGQAIGGVSAQNAKEAKNGEGDWGRLDGGASGTGDDDNVSDEDADAEMDVDAFSHMHTPISRSMVSPVGAAVLASQQPQNLHPPPLRRRHLQQAISTRLRVPRNRGTGQKNLSAVTETAAVGNPTDNLLPASHPMPSMNATEMHGFSDLDDLGIPALGGNAMFM